MKGDGSGDGRGQSLRPQPVPPASIEAGPGTNSETSRIDPADPLEATWIELERIGRDTGHVLVRCPGCGNRAMVSILNGSGTSRWAASGGGWPRCKQCCPGADAPRVEPVGDVALVGRVRPGHCMTERELKRVTKARDARRAAPENGP